MSRIVSEVVTELISEVLGISPVEPDMSIHNTLQWDSLAHLKILAAIEGHFECELDLDEISEVQSVQDWIDVVDRRAR